MRINSNIRCQRIYPTEDTNRTIAGLKTVGILLNREQAVHLARALLTASQDLDAIDITGYRHERRTTDGTYHLTVTGTVDTDTSEGTPP